MPPWRNAFSRTHLIEASSSTSHTLSGFTGVGGIEWQQNRENGPTRSAIEFDEPVVARDELLCDGKPKPGAVAATRYEWIEQRIAQLFRHARSVVLELNARDHSMSARADAHVGQRSRTQDESSARLVRLRDSLQGISPQIEHCLHDQVAIHAYGRQARVVISLDGHARSICCEQVVDVLQRLVDVDQFLARGMPRSEQRIDE